MDVYKNVYDNVMLKVKSADFCSLLSCYIERYAIIVFRSLTHISLASFLWDIGKENSPRWDAAKRGVPSGAILFAEKIFIEK